VMSEVLVASKNIDPGVPLAVDSVRWQAWPKTQTSPNFILKELQPDIAKAIADTIVRAPLVAGQPITDVNTVHANAAGFLAASIKPGMRAVGVVVNAQKSAGGFILPNDRVDVVLTRETPQQNGSVKDYVSYTVVRDVRVLAIDQTAKQEKGKDSVVGKTATLELTPTQTEVVVRSAEQGELSLALRSLGDSSGEPTTGASGSADPAPATAENTEKSAPAAPLVRSASASPRPSVVTVFRYGLSRGNESSAPVSKNSARGAEESANSVEPAEPAMPNVASATAEGVSQ
jgi:pilus assembly protein CpaB